MILAHRPVSALSLVNFASTIMVLLRSFAFALVLAGLVHTAAVWRQGPVIVPLSPSKIASYAPFTHFASTAYCNPFTTINWSYDCASLAALSNAPRSPDILMVLF